MISDSWIALNTWQTWYNHRLTINIYAILLQHSNHCILIGDVRISTKINLFEAEMDGHEARNTDELFMDLNFLNNSIN